MNDAPNPPPPQPPTRTAQLPLLLVALLVFYTAPVLLAAYNWITRSSSELRSVFDATLPITRILLYMAENKKEYLGLFHQLIVPVMAAFTAFGFDHVRKNRAAAWLFVVPLLFLFLSILFSIVFQFLTDLSDTQVKSVSAFFVDIAQNLSVYVLMLFGLEGAYQRK